MSDAAREQSVSDRMIRVYAAVAVVALVGLLGYTGVALLLEHGRSLERANSEFAALNGALTAVYLEQRTLSSDAFRQAAAEALAQPGGPEAILVSSNAEGVAYAAAVGADRLLVTQGTPTDIAPRPLLRVLSAPFRGARELQLHASYPLLQATDAFPILRTALFAVLVFVLLSGIAFVLRVILQPRQVGQGRPVRPGGSARAARPTAATSPAPPSARAGPRTSTSRQAPGAAAARPRRRPRRSTPSATPGSMIAATGISRADFLRERLDSELTRAGGLDAELCLALVAGRGIDGDRHRYVRLGAILREVAVVPDLAFEYGESGFALIMPETELGDAIERLGSVRSLYDRDGQGVGVAIGISQRGGRLIDGKRLFAEAKRALERAVRSGGNQLVGFRADPVKFRRQQSVATG